MTRCERAQGAPPPRFGSAAGASCRGRTRRNADGATTGSGRSMRRSGVVAHGRSSSSPNRWRTASAYAAPSALTAASFMRIGRQMQELVQDLRGDRLERPPLVVADTPFTLASSAERISSARARSEAIAGHDVERRAPGPEPLRLLGDELLGALGLGAAARERLGDDGLEVVDVVEEAAVEPCDRAGSRSRGTAMSMKKSGRRRRAGTSPARSTSSGRARRGDDDVDVVELSRRCRPARSPRRRTLRDRARRALEAAVRDVGDRRAARDEVGRGELADPPGADQQHAAAGRDRRTPARPARRPRRRPTPGSRRSPSRCARACRRRAPGGRRGRAAGRARPPRTRARTWPRISPSPGTSESSPAATRKRCSAAASSAAGRGRRRAARRRAARAPRRRRLRRRRREIELGAIAGREADGVAERAGERRRARSDRASPARAARPARRDATDRRSVERHREVASGEREPSDDHEREAAEREVGGAAAGRPRDDERAVDEPGQQRHRLERVEVAAVTPLADDADQRGRPSAAAARRRSSAARAARATAAAAGAAAGCRPRDSSAVAPPRGRGRRARPRG